MHIKCMHVQSLYAYTLLRSILLWKTVIVYLPF